MTLLKIKLKMARLMSSSVDLLKAVKFVGVSFGFGYQLSCCIDKLLMFKLLSDYVCGKKPRLTAVYLYNFWCDFSTTKNGS